MRRVVGSQGQKRRSAERRRRGRDDDRPRLRNRRTGGSRRTGTMTGKACATGIVRKRLRRIARYVAAAYLESCGGRHSVR